MTSTSGPGAGDLQWTEMSPATQRWWVSYVVARIAPFANVIGYQFAWESPGNDTATDYGLATLLRELDPFHHGVRGLALALTVSCQRIVHERTNRVPGRAVPFQQPVP